MHHTKFKADIGLTKIIADLVTKGQVPCLPLSEHQPSDLVSVMKNSRTIKIQVKYAKLKDNGTVDVKFRTGWVDKQGTHTRKYKNSDFDYYAIYCLGKETVLYVPNTKNCPKAIRFEKPSNNQRRHVKWANSYLDIESESSETIRRTPEKVKT